MMKIDWKQRETDIKIAKLTTQNDGPIDQCLAHNGWDKYIRKDDSSYYMLLCRKCGKPITKGQEYAMFEEGPEAFHMDCLTCVICGKGPTWGEAFITDHDGETLYCGVHWDEKEEKNEESLPNDECDDCGFYNDTCKGTLKGNPLPSDCWHATQH